MNDRLLTVAELAELLRVPQTQVESWSEQGCPAADEAGSLWRMADVRAWLTDQLRKAPEESGELATIRTAEFDRKRALADRTQLEVARLRNEYVSRAEVRELLGRVSSTLKRAFRDMPHKLAGLAPHEMEREFDDLLDQLADELQSVRV